MPHFCTFIQQGLPLRVARTSTQVVFLRALFLPLTYHTSHPMSGFSLVMIGMNALQNICKEGSAELICELSSDKRKCTATDAPLLAWIPECQAFLDETLHLKGCGNAGDSCFCGLAAPVFRCWDCFGIHMSNPLHRIDVSPYHMWSNSYFQCTSLKQISLCMQLGHNPGEICYNPHPSTGDDFIVIDVHGIHEIMLDFCGCASSQVHYKQLLRAHWYPATTSEPHTAATFSLLEHFHLLSFKSKVSAYEFYQSLARRNNNAGLLPIRDRYSAFMHIVREWCHDPAGVIATSAGELAAQCPVCPHSGKNIPEGWQDVPLTVRWKYTLFVAIDVNFRLKWKAVSLDNIDPNLNSGWAYFVEEAAYKSYLADQASVKQECSTCSSCGLAVTGVGAVDCARHNMKLANSVGDSRLAGSHAIKITYSSLLHVHPVLHSEIPPQSTHRRVSAEFFIQLDQTHRTNGREAPKHGCTKEMGPGSRRDTLDNHFGDWNWKKIIVLGLFFFSFIILCQVEKGIWEALTELENTIQPTLIIQWRKEVEAWEEDNSNSNPFESRYTRITQAAVWLQLAELQAGTNVSLHTDISPSGLITTGMDLQDQQQRLKMDIVSASLHPTDKQKSNMQLRITTLQRRLDAWAHVQELYMPVMSQLHHQTSDASMLNTVELNPDTFKLWLPSELQPMTVCNESLAAHEWKLCHAQALDALTELRSHLRLWSLYTSSTCTQAIINGVELRKQVSVEKYRHACNALLTLSHRLHQSGWEILLPPLLDSDVRPMGDMESQGTGTISWIWLDSRADNSSSENEQVQDCEFMRHSVHVEWCKAHA
ncbi:uncharacterized protein F5891DRAFT_1131024 [Suillus fuscotomentosus]|uniref:CxC2-like cysteine cluster KDZ transposase-associated domain-containing protein n=1 Tax=Suillus fuscotomentosus TaxID=1912939 RepID=A0AAD4HE25_9AGAM|nr:uncharacterized protein F5891DRAFT_1131024 [Suillus fuscotomentosus]KAG1894210.1 hypothetical protein F5891DRAFT_1131024 [Suillus fuscotomentosus]